MRWDAGFWNRFICWNEVIVELKTVEQLTDKHIAQVINDLKATGLRRALLINFFANKRLEYRRIVLPTHK